MKEKGEMKKERKEKGERRKENERDISKDKNLPRLFNG